jgi:hypothetical protein
MGLQVMPNPVYWSGSIRSFPDGSTEQTGALEEGAGMAVDGEEFLLKPPRED